MLADVCNMEVVHPRPAFVLGYMLLCAVIQADLCVKELLCEGKHVAKCKSL